MLIFVIFHIVDEENNYEGLLISNNRTVTTLFQIETQVAWGNQSYHQSECTLDLS